MLSNIFGDSVVYFIGDKIYDAPLLLPYQTVENGFEILVEMKEIQ